MHDDRWLHFAHWAAEQVIDLLGPQIAIYLSSLFESHGLSPQTVKGNRPCLALVPSHTGRAAIVQHRIISDMISSMELERPRHRPILPEWDLDMVLEALIKPPYETLQEASLKHLTYKTCLPSSHGLDFKTY